MRYLNTFKRAFSVAITMFIICGLIYPLLMTGISQAILPTQANGSLIKVKNHIVGSKLVGQEFTGDRFFHSRPSAVNYNTYTDKSKYKGISSGSENLAVSNPKLKKRIDKEIEKILKDNPTISKKDIPEDIITESGSGLDPNISIKAAYIQTDRVAKNTGLSKEKIYKLINKNINHKVFGLFGENTVNVLELNISLLNEIQKIK